MSSLSKNFRLSSTLKIEEEAMAITKNQGIGSILGSGNCDERSTNSSSSLRRTLSADHMSSTKWLTQHGFSPMKKIASSEEFSICSITDSSSSEDDEEEEEDGDETNDDEPRGQFDIWNSIQEEVAKKKELDRQKQGQFDIWSSIIQQKSQEITGSKPLAPPYIHPLVKRSASSLNEKSLEICTESLGSETGSDGFSSYPSSESGDDDKETEQEQQERVEQSLSFPFEAMSIPKYNYVAGKKSPAQQRQQRSFPPPIPSRGNGASSIRMQSRRDNGRLVLEAVSVPSTTNFLAQRQDGRLVLTFVNSTEQVGPKIEREEVKEMEEEFENFDDDDDDYVESDDEDEAEEEEEEKEAAFVMEPAPPKLLSSRVINVHRLSSLMGLANRDPTWPNKFNEVVKFDEAENDIKPTIVAKSLPPMPRMIPKARAAAEADEKGTVTEVAFVAAAGGGGGGVGGGGVSFNAYEYYWRPKPMTAAQSKGGGGGGNNINYSENNHNNYNNKLILSKNSMGNNNNQEQQQLLVLRGNRGDYWVPLLKSCKEPRRSLLFWEPYCIATS